MRRSLAKLYVPQLRASGVYIKTAKSFLSLCPFKSFEKEVIKTGEYFKDTSQKTYKLERATVVKARKASVATIDFKN